MTTFGGVGGYRYGPWDGGPDPLAAPFDAEAVLVGLVFAGFTAGDAAALCTV